MVELLPIQAAHVLVERKPARQHLPSIRNSRFCQSRAFQAGLIVPADSGERRTIVQEDAGPSALVLAQEVRAPAVKSTEVKELQRLAVDEVPCLLPGEIARVQVPIRNVVRRVLEDDVIEEGRNEVNPSLIGKHHARRIDACLAPRPQPPPIDELFGAWADGDETKVVDARGEDVKVVDPPAV